MEGNRCRSAGTYTMPARALRWAGRRVSSFPSRTIRPAIAGSSPAIARKNVVFPAPFEPTIATASPVRTSTSIPSMTGSPRYPAASPTTSSNSSPPEIRVDDLRVPHDDLGRALRQDLAEVEDDRSLGELDDGAHHVLDPQDGSPERVADVPYDRDRSDDLGLVEARHHLVEQQHARLACKRLRQLEETQLMEVQARDGQVGSLLQPDERQRLGGPPPRLSLADDAVADAEHRSEDDVLEDGHRAEGERSLHRHRDPLASERMGGETVDPLTVQ